MPANQVISLACLLDSDIVIDFLRHRQYARILLEKWSRQGLLAISALTHLEVYQGIKANEEEATDAFLKGLVSIAMDVPIAQRAGNLLRELRRKGITLSIGDAIIAATALQANIPLLTNNIAHYPFNELKVIRGTSS